MFTVWTGNTSDFLYFSWRQISCAVERHCCPKTHEWHWVTCFFTPEESDYFCLEMALKNRGKIVTLRRSSLYSRCYCTCSETWWRLQRFPSLLCYKSQPLDLMLKVKKDIYNVALSIIKRILTLSFNKSILVWIRWISVFIAALYLADCLWTADWSQSLHECSK